MADRYRIEPATAEAAAHVGAHMRKADVDEIRAMSGLDPVAACLKGLELSPDARIGLIDGTPAVVFGVVPSCLLTRKGVPWLLATPELPRHAKAFLGHSRGLLADMERTYAHLSNFVDARNRQSKRWLRWLGFEIAPQPHPYGPQGLPFHYFEKRN